MATSTYMAKIYANLVYAGARTLSSVPANLKTEVEGLLVTMYADGIMAGMKSLIDVEAQAPDILERVIAELVSRGYTF